MPIPDDSDARAPLLRTSTGRSATSAAASRFGLSPSQFKRLFADRRVDDLQSLGGIKGVIEALKVDPTIGLSSDERMGGNEVFAVRRAAFGRNVLPVVAQKSFMSLVYEAFQDKILILLSLASLVSLAVGLYEDFGPHHPPNEPRVGWVEGFAILVAVIVVVLTNAINDYQKEKQFRILNAKKDDRTVKVFRDARECEISIFDLNVGDVMLLEPGEIVPIDGLFISGHNLTCDESSATGESDPLKKDIDVDPFILSGSKIVEGVGRILVCAVGQNSFYGEIMMSLRGAEATETPLQHKLDVLAEQIAKFGISASLVLFLTLIIKYLVNSAMEPEFPPVDDVVSMLIKVLLQAITILVVAVPEGLPMAVTLALAYATTQMLRENNLVRILSACETMGSATVVCTDKTGTLTQNVMTVVEGVISGRHFDRNTSSESNWRDELAPIVFHLLSEGIAVNSTAFLGKDDTGRPTFIGSKTESALLGMIVRMGVAFEDIRTQCRQIRAYPFSSQKKVMSAVVETHVAPEATYRLYTKGASEFVLRYCTKYLAQDGSVKNLDAAARAAFERTITQFADKALRTICLAYRDVSHDELEHMPEDDAPNKDLIAIGIVGIMDPLRPGVTDSVNACRNAGVVVKMITGDNVQTAKAIAKNAGIYTKGGVCITGPEFRALSEAERIRLVPRLQVLARASPLDKQIVIHTLQGLGEVAAMTGDGSNDGPSLKKSDVGFAMGIAGTEVAKEAADIVLMDDNFNSIVAAIRWGRGVNDSVRKFLQFQLTVNFCAVVLAFVSSVIDPNSESVLTATQLLWVNLIMDTLAALALATEAPADDVLNRFPLSKKASLISFDMWKMIIGQAAFQVAVNLLLLRLGPAIFHLKDHGHDRVVMRTIIFNTFVMLQLFNMLNSRRVDDSINVFRGLWKNHSFLIIQLFIILGQIFIVNFGGIAFKTTPISLGYWIVCISVGFLSLPVGIIIRLLPDFGLRNLFPAEVRKPLVSEQRLLLESTAEDVRRKMKVFSALRRTLPPRVVIKPQHAAEQE